MCNCSNPNKGDLITGIAFGALVGAGIALLFAPEEGAKTRKKLKKHGEKAIDKMGKAMREIEEKKIKPSVDNAKREVTDKAKEVKKAIDSKIDGIKSKVSKSQEG